MDWLWSIDAVARGAVLGAAAVKALPALPQSYYRRGAAQVARELLGKILVRRVGRSLVAGAIVEVEAYLGADDPASHSHRGMTPRNRSMFRAGGACYVYLSYGVNHCMNVVTGVDGVGEAVLVRAVAPLVGLETMADRRGLPVSREPRVLRQLASGPGKLTRALAVSIEDDGASLVSRSLWIADLGVELTPARVAATPRIGITKAAELPLRFVVRGSPWLSRPEV